MTMPAAAIERAAERLAEARLARRRLRGPARGLSPARRGRGLCDPGGAAPPSRRGRLRRPRRSQDRLHHAGDAAVPWHRQSLRRRRARAHRPARPRHVPPRRLPARGGRVRDRGAPGRDLCRPPARPTTGRTSPPPSAPAWPRSRWSTTATRTTGSLDTPTLIADDFFNAACVLGEPVASWHELDLARVGGRMTINRSAVGTGPGGDILGHPLERARLARQRARSARPPTRGRRVRPAGQRGPDQLGRGRRSGRDRNREPRPGHLLLRLEPLAHPDVTAQPRNCRTSRTETSRRRCGAALHCPGLA